MENYSLTVNKSATLAGQDCNVSLGMTDVKTVRA